MLSRSISRMKSRAPWAIGGLLLTTGIALADKDSKFKDYFDAEAYERAAKALKEIEKSVNAKQV